MQFNKIFASGGRENIRQSIIEKLYDVKVELVQVNGYAVVVPKAPG